MKRTLLVLSLLMSVQAMAFDSMSSGDKNTAPKQEKKKDGVSSESLYSEVECDMTDFNCYKPILDLGRQEAILVIAEDRLDDKYMRSTVLNEAIEVYRAVNEEAHYLDDSQIILLLAAEQ